MINLKDFIESLGPEAKSYTQKQLAQLHIDVERLAHILIAVHVSKKDQEDTHIDDNLASAIVKPMSEPITQPDLKNLREQLNEDMKTHIGTLYEKFSSDVGLLSEQVSSIDNRVITVERKLDVIIDAVADLKVEATEEREHQRRLDNRIAILEAR